MGVMKIFISEKKIRKKGNCKKVRKI